MAELEGLCCTWWCYWYGQDHVGECYNNTSNGLAAEKLEKERVGKRGLANNRLPRHGR